MASTIYISGNPTKTHLKEIYKRMCDMKATREKYTFENNKIIFSGEDDEIKVVNKMWLSNISNIKRFAILIVDENQNIDDISFNNINIDKNISVLYDLTITSLKNLNKMLYDDYSELINMDTLRIPNCNYYIIKSLMIKNKMVIMIDTINQSQCDLNVKYMIALDDDEISRFKKHGHEYLIKQYITKSYKIQKGVNNIIPFSTKNVSNDNNSQHEFNYLDLPVKIDGLTTSHLFITTPKTSLIKGKIYLERICAKNKEDSGDLIFANTDFEYTKCSINDCHTYIYDAYDNIKQTNTQPYGSFYINDNFRIKIFSEEEMTISVTYVFFNCVRYMMGKFNLGYGCISKYLTSDEINDYANVDDKYDHGYVFVKKKKINYAKINNLVL